MEIAVSDNKVERTRSGLFVRNDNHIGLLVYSPFTGLTYAIHHSHGERVLQWLEGRIECPEGSYRRTLGAGWASPIDDFNSVGQRLLPTPELWGTVPATDYPILINWFLTGKCPLDCVYCYAEDLMRDRVNEPNQQDIENRVERILSFNPLMVVLTGGDPLSSPYLSRAIELLSGRTGIVVDTSAYSFSESKLRLFKKHGVNVRISLDSEIPAINQKQRPPLGKRESILTAIPAVDAISRCLDEDIFVTVQTVATKKNSNDLISLGDKLFQMGVRSWRVFKVAPSEIKQSGYRLLVGDTTDKGEKYHGKKARGPYAYNFELLTRARTTRWSNEMEVQVTFNERVNSVILVGPDGVFYTESNVRLGKVEIDEKNPKKPSLESIRSKVDMIGHVERYLNLTYKKALS